MILLDTSAWVEYDRATGSGVDLRVAELLAAGGEKVAATEPVLMEVLAGARDEHRAVALRRLLVSCAWLPLDPAADFEAAARIYRACRRAGITPRGLVDCVVAAVASRTGAALLAADGDFRQMARVIPLALDPASA